MPNWLELLKETQTVGGSHDIVRRKYLTKLHELTGRNVIAYYSGWLQKQAVGPAYMLFEVNDADKNGFMATIHKLDRTKGLDLILHTPGGQTAATESLVDYLRAMFGTDMRAVVPQLAMSAGTMIALACDKIIMGKHSSLGPIDPQIGGRAAHGIIEEFNRAALQMRADPSAIALWQPILHKYTPTLVGECEKAMKWGEQMVQEWLRTGMFRDCDPTVRDAKIQTVLTELGSHSLTLSHARHISAAQARAFGLEIVNLEDNDDLQEAVLSVHHAYVQTFGDTPAVKIIENHCGVSHIHSAANH